MIESKNNAEAMPTQTHFRCVSSISKIVANIIAPKLSRIFEKLIVIPKGDPAPDRENYRPISITAILSKGMSS